MFTPGPTSATLARLSDEEQLIYRATITLALVLWMVYLIGAVVIWAVLVRHPALDGTTLVVVTLGSPLIGAVCLLVSRRVIGWRYRKISRLADAKAVERGS